MRRLAFCGRVVRDTDAGVVVKVTGQGEDARAGFSGLQTCGSVWSCPVCSEKINAGRQAELETGIRNWIAAGNAVLFGTFTMRHHAGQTLEELWDAITPSWNRAATGSRAGKADWTTFGIVGTVRLVEIKHGVNGWHVHLHVLFFVECSPTDDDVDQVRHRIFGRWSAALGRRGLTALEFDRTGQAIGADLRRVIDGQGVADYFAKNTYGGGTTASAAAYEVTGSHSKRAGKGGRTPFEILAALVVSVPELVDTTTGEIRDGDRWDSRSRDAALWREWEETSRGRRQLVWSRGLRDRLALGSESTDEELAEDDSLAGETECALSADEWKSGGWALRRDELLDLAEAGELVAFLAAWRRSRYDNITSPAAGWRRSTNGP